MLSAENAQPDRTRVLIIGAGPAGLTAAYALSKQGVPVTVLEADPKYAGGISRTIQHKGFCFDIGGHRFFSKSKQIEDLWTEILPDDMLERPRLSRILYKGKFYSYPLKPFEALFKLGIIESGLCGLSYLHARLRPRPNPKSFEDWVTNQFGSRLFGIFFKTYTEKVWGMSCKDISADWAAQRIKGLSLGSAIWNGLRRKPSGDRASTIKTLIDSFRYPRKGPGMLWEACAERVRQRGGQIRMGERVTECAFDQESRRWSVTSQSSDGELRKIGCDHVISSAPLRELMHSLRPAASDEAVRAASALKYRDFLTVAIMLKDHDHLPDNWIYLHDSRVKAGRVQNYKSWSPDMVPDPALCCYGLEYFCFEGDGLWSSTNEELISLATRELVTLGLAAEDDIIDGSVVRQPKAYPVYDGEYSANVAVLRDELARTYPGMHLVGRNGMHKYNNQDHAMMTGLLTAENIVSGRTAYDVWQVNQDAEYHEAGAVGEQGGTSGLRLVPSRASA